MNIIGAGNLELSAVRYCTGLIVTHICIVTLDNASQPRFAETGDPSLAPLRAGGGVESPVLQDVLLPSSRRGGI